MNALEAEPLGYIEDAFEARTKLTVFFSSLQEGDYQVRKGPQSRWMKCLRG
jgi:hypothetical protein